MSDLHTAFGDLKDTPPEKLYDALVESGRGVDGLLDDVFARLRAGFDPARTHGEEGTFKFVVTAPDGDHVRFVNVAGGQVIVDPHETRPPDVTLTLALPDFVGLVTGELPGQQAFLSGKLKVDGDPFFAMNWAEWFGTG